VSRIKSHLMRNLELYLIGISVAVALVLPLAIEVGTDDQELAVTALAACVVQGLLLWFMRRRSRRVRQEMIGELRAMLKDRINNHLTVVLMSVSQRRSSPASENERELLQMAIASTAAVSRVLDELSVESLRRWKAKYQMDAAELQTIGASMPHATELRVESIPRDRGAAGSRIRR
jgi:peptidoglycan biosynthesis protein MviN/MurJ (putative lipid II flippase)